MGKRSETIGKEGTGAPGRADPGGEGARERILRAAYKVFAQYPFGSASTRMIAAEAGVDLPLIHYYYGSKEKLFETVARNYFSDFLKAHAAWFDQLQGKMPREGLPLYLDLLLEYCFQRPQSFQIFMLNVATLGREKAIPGYDEALDYYKGIIETTLSRFPELTPRSEFEMFVHCMNNVVVSFIGARYLQAELLGLDPDGPEYRERVKSALLAMFTPWLERIFVSTLKAMQARSNPAPPPQEPRPS